MQMELTTEERNWAMAAHLSALVAVAGVPFGHVIGPLVVYLARGAQSPYVAGHARASLNYQLTISIAGLVVLIVGAIFFAGSMLAAAPAAAHSKAASDALGVSIVSIGLVVGLIVLLCLVMSIVFIIMGTIAAGEGRPYTYPFAICFLR